MKNNSSFSIKFILFRIILITFALSIIFILTEFALRIIPIPGIEMGTGIYDPEMRLYKFTPN